MFRRHYKLFTFIKKDGMFYRVFWAEEGELKIRSFNESLKHARDLVKQYNSSNQDLVELLFQMRRGDTSHD